VSGAGGCDNQSQDIVPTVRFINEPSFDLTYDDVFMVPSRSAIGSRLEVDLTPV